MKKSSNEDLFAAARYGCLEKVMKCLADRVDIHAQNDLTLRWAAQNGHLDVVQYLLEQGANIHAETESALHCAAQSGHLAVVRYLLEQGADIHARNEWALHCAAINSHLQTARYLMVRGADLGEAEKYEWWLKDVGKTTAEMLSSFAICLREKKELDMEAPEIGIRSQNRRL